jgi:hypothetical protein
MEKKLELTILIKILIVFKKILIFSCHMSWRGSFNVSTDASNTD